MDKQSVLKSTATQECMFLDLTLCKRHVTEQITWFKYGSRGLWAHGKIEHLKRSKVPHRIIQIKILQIVLLARRSPEWNKCSFKIG